MENQQVRFDSAQTVVLKILRQDGPGESSYWDTFEVPRVPYMNVLSCLVEIRKNPVNQKGKTVRPVVWESACLEEVCGACTMLINGKVRQSCSALVDRFPGVIELRPMTKFPVVRDLVVERKKIFNDFKKVHAWVDIDGTHALGPGPRQSPALAETRYALSRCMACGCCLEVCPNYGEHSSFIGAAPINQVRLFQLHPSGAMHGEERLRTLMEPGGVQDCGSAQNCVRACPQHIPLTTSIADMMRETTKQGLFGLLRKPG